MLKLDSFEVKRSMKEIYVFSLLKSRSAKIRRFSGANNTLIETNKELNGKSVLMVSENAQTSQYPRSLIKPFTDYM